MAFNTALSGIRVANADLNIIGHNVANAGTVGFKSSRAEFADVYAASTLGTSSLAIGSGARLAATAQQFKQGNINFTDNPLDLAINGDGFFRLNDNGAIVYTRAGMFKMDKQGYVTTNDGLRLTGYRADSMGNITGQIGDLKLDIVNIDPKQTGVVTAALNLDSAEVEPAGAWTGASPPLPDSYNRATPVTIFDSLGNPHDMIMYFRKLDPDGTAVPPIDPNTWEVYIQVDGVDVGSETLVFNPDGSFDLSSYTPAVYTFNPLDANGNPNGAVPNQQFSISFAGTTQFSSAFATNALTQDGYTTGRMAGLDIDPSGVLFARYTNGQSKAMGQVALANFANPQGLQPLGGTNWGETSTSGLPLVGMPGTASLGVIQSSALEDSNVDLTQELVKMIVAQRNYQANAQSIRAEDAVTQTVINLR